jgi:hypothetical protein
MNAKMKLILFALVAGAAAQSLPLCIVGNGNCPSYSICGYVPAAYAGPNGTAVCANITTVNTCVPGVEILDSRVDFPIVSAIVTAYVCDDNGNRVPIGGLLASNLILQEDGRSIPAESSGVIAIGDIPKLRTVILVDVSYSMTGGTPSSVANYFFSVNSSLTNLFSSLIPAASPPSMRGHLVSIGTFSGGTTQILCNYVSLSDTTASITINRCLASMDILAADDSSNIYDTIVNAVAAVDAANHADPEYNAASPLYFSTVLLVSDGVDSAQVATMNQAIQSNTVVAAIGTGAYLNASLFQFYLQPSQNVPFMGTVGPYSPSGNINPMLQYFGAKVMVRGMYAHTGQYFIRYCSPARGNANGQHTLSISLADPASMPKVPLSAGTSANVAFTAVPGAGPCYDRYSRVSATVIPGKMTINNGGNSRYACAFTGSQQYIAKFFCPSVAPTPSIMPSVSPTAVVTATPSNSRMPVPFAVTMNSDLDGHSVGAGIGIALAIFVSAACVAVCVIGTKAGIISFPCIRNTWASPNANKAGPPAVVSTNPMTHVSTGSGI